MKRLLMFIAVLVIPASVLAQVVPPPAPKAPPTPPAPMSPLAPVAPKPVTGIWAEPFLANIDMLAAQEAMERAKWKMEDSLIHFDSMKWELPVMHNFDFDMQDVHLTTSSNSAYDAGLSLLSKRDYDRAILRFDQVISQKGTRADAAAYHKAYALYRLGRSSDATTALNTLKKEYPKSAYLKDASVLDAAVRQSAGPPLRPDQADEDALKMLALNALVH